MKLYILVISFSNIDACHNAGKNVDEFIPFVVWLSPSILLYPCEGQCKDGDVTLLLLKAPQRFRWAAGSELWLANLSNWRPNVDRRGGSEIQWCFYWEADDINKSYILGLMLHNKASEEYQTFLITQHHFYSLDALDPPFVTHWCTLLHCQCEILYHILYIIPP